MAAPTIEKPTEMTTETASVHVPNETESKPTSKLPSKEALGAAATSLISNESIPAEISVPQEVQEVSHMPIDENSQLFADDDRSLSEVLHDMAAKQRTTPLEKEYALDTMLGPTTLLNRVQDQLKSILQSVANTNPDLLTNEQREILAILEEAESKD